MSRVLVIANRNYSSWSLRPWLAMKQAGIAFEERRIALDRPQTIGRRYIAADRAMRMPELTAVLKAAYPARRIPTRTAPRLLMRLVALFDPAIRMILPALGRPLSIDNTAARRDFALTFVPAEESVRRTAAFLTQSA